MSYCMRCSVWVCRLRLAVVWWSCVVSCVHCAKVNFRTGRKLCVWVCRLWLAVVLWSCIVNCVHCVKVNIRTGRKLCALCES